MMRILTAIIALSFATAAQAQEEKSPWQHESEVSLISVDGNTTSESYSAKQKTQYTFLDANTLALTARYLNTRANGVETARSWDAAARYERAFSEFQSGYVGHGAESDVYNGYIQRDNTDIGAKHFFSKSDATTFFAELGYRYTKQLSTIGGVSYDNYGRLYTELAQKQNEAVSYKFWIEYLPNFTHNDAYLLNAEPSINVMLTKVFSLKTAYLVKYRNEIAPGEKHADTTFTTSVVAKF